jgi:hypothetical protein
MADIERYMPENADGTDLWAEPGDSYQEARDVAYEAGGKVIVYEYSFEDSHVVDDFTDEEHIGDTGEGDAEAGPRCPVCKTDEWDFRSNNLAECVNGHQWTVDEDELEDVSPPD